MTCCKAGLTCTDTHSVCKGSVYSQPQRIRQVKQEHTVFFGRYVLLDSHLKLVHDGRENRRDGACKLVSDDFNVEMGFFMVDTDGVLHLDNLSRESRQFKRVYEVLVTYITHALDEAHFLVRAPANFICHFWSCKNDEPVVPQRHLERGPVELEYEGGQPWTIGPTESNAYDGLQFACLTFR